MRPPPEVLARLFATLAPTAYRRGHGHSSRRRLILLDGCYRDARQAARALRRSPVAAVASVIVLALGIGATTSIFSIFNALLLRPLALLEVDRIVRLELIYPDGGSHPYVSEPHFVFWRRNSSVFESLAASSPGVTYNLTGQDAARSVRGSKVTKCFFATSGLELMLGNGFSGEDPGSALDEAVLSYDLWESEFGADPAVLGRRVTLDRRSFTIVGVASPRPSVPHLDSKLWTPLHVDESSRERANIFSVTGRLKAGVGLEQAQAEMNLVQAQLLGLAGAPEDAERVWVRSLQESLYGSQRPTLIMLLSIAGFILLLACANVTNLQLSRLASRNREIAIRAALGGSVYRTLRPLAFETILVTLAGGSLGVGLSVLGTYWLSRSSPDILASTPPLKIVDVRVLIFAFLIASLAAILGGLDPALQAKKVDLRNALTHRSAGSTAATKGSWIRHALVTSEITLTLLAVLTATLLLKSYVGLSEVDPGFDPTHVVTVELPLSKTDSGEPRNLDSLRYELFPKIEGLPGVASVGASTALPVESSDYLYYNVVDDDSLDGSLGDGALAQFRAISPKFFETLGIPLVRGRAFGASDGAEAPKVVIINETAARRRWANADPIGRQIKVFPGSQFGEPFPRTVVGVVGNVSELALAEAYDWESLYVPLAQLALPLARPIFDQPLLIVVKSETDPGPLMRLVSQTIRDYNPEQPIARARLMDEVIRDSMAPQEFRTTVTSGFAALALLLAIVGVYGVFSVLAGARRQEFAIRTALGAGPRQLVQQILGRGMLSVVAGIAFGLLGTFLAQGLLESFLYGVSATDPQSVVTVTLALLGVTLVAMLGPALRAANVDPTDALRHE